MANRLISLCILTFLLAAIPANFSHATPKIIDSLNATLPYLASDTHKVWVLRDIAYYYQSENPDSALHFARRGNTLARNLNFYPGRIWNLYQEGLAYELLNQVDTAVKIYHRALELTRESHDDQSRAKLYNVLGVAHYFDGDYTEAIHYYSMGFLLADSISYEEGKAHALNNLGVIYRKQRRFDKALETYKRSLDLKMSERDTAGMIISYYNIGLSHSYLNDYEKSLEYFKIANEMARANIDLGWDRSHIKIGLGVAYFNLGDFEAAKIQLRDGIRESSVKTSSEYISARAYLGAILTAEGDFKEGMQLVENAWQMAAQSGHRVLLRDVLKQRALSAERAGKPEVATESWKLFTELNE